MGEPMSKNEELDLEAEDMEPEAAEDEAENEIDTQEQVEDESDEVQLQDAEDDQAESEEEPERLIVSFDDEHDDEPAGPAIKALRRSNRDQQKVIKELKKKLESLEAPKKIEVGEKPKLEDFDYDADAFESALFQWKDKKAEADAVARKEREQEEARRQRFQERHEAYTSAKSGLGAKDFEDAEESVIETLSEAQQNIILVHAKRPELVVYALGKNPEIMDRLANSEDVVAFAYQLAQLEASMRVPGAMRKPAPEKRLKGGKGPALSADKQLEKLEAEAERTGDRTKVIAYKRKMRKK